MKKQNNTVGAVEAFLHDMEQGECEYSEIFNVMGVNELTYLVKMAKKGEEVTYGVKHPLPSRPASDDPDEQYPETPKKDYIIGVDLAREEKDEIQSVEEEITTEPESIEGTKEK